MPDLSQAEKDLLLKKHARATQLRAEFNKLISNPHRHATMEGGHVVSTIYQTENSSFVMSSILECFWFQNVQFQFDHGMQRFQAMSVTNFDHFKPTWKSLKVGFFGCILPIAAYAYFLKKERDGREHLYRTGQVAYKDRQFKFI